eukprot:TRINITY_DN6719_c0_g1_i2.p1 TRINITY_DN6719_c0_g1~~TRINITY_DN6719_c0_g1_i2.p1  ORF type:complete len:287 (-),score=-6.02 TRINITY_DN6719_c0_g1_i2:151-1011(-)
MDGLPEAGLAGITGAGSGLTLGGTPLPITTPSALGIANLPPASLAMINPTVLQHLTQTPSATESAKGASARYVPPPRQQYVPPTRGEESKEVPPAPAPTPPPMWSGMPSYPQFGYPYPYPMAASGYMPAPAPMGYASGLGMPLPTPLPGVISTPAVATVSGTTTSPAEILPPGSASLGSATMPIMATAPSTTGGITSQTLTPSAETPFPVATASVPSFHHHISPLESLPAPPGSSASVSYPSYGSTMYSAPPAGPVLVYSELGPISVEEKRAQLAKYKSSETPTAS